MPAPSPTSLVDAVDELDRPVGLIERREVRAAGVGFRVVHIFVIDLDGDLLLQQVGRGRERSPLRWGSSVAGYVAAGESYQEAAFRRQREELGIDDALERIGAVRMQDGSAHKFIELYLSRARDARIVDNEHVEQIALWSIKDIEERLEDEPDVFTETFPVVFRLFRAACP